MGEGVGSGGAAFFCFFTQAEAVRSQRWRPCSSLVFTDYIQRNCPPVRAHALGAQCFSLRKIMTLPILNFYISFKSGLFYFLTQAEAVRSQCMTPLLVAYVFFYVLQVLFTNEGACTLSHGFSLRQKMILPILHHQYQFLNYCCPVKLCYICLSGW